MFFLLSKILHYAFMPFTWVAVLLLLSLIWKKRSRQMLISAVILVFVFGNAFLLHEVNRMWEIPMQPDSVASEANAAVVLGGYTYYNPTHERLVFRNSSDRIMQALRLLQSDQISMLFLSGGSGFVTIPEMKEAAFVEVFLKDLGVDHTNLVVEADSRNTYENAKFVTDELVNYGYANERILLITSGYHMRRAMLCFEERGIEVIPYPTDSAVGDRMWDPAHILLPSAEAMFYWNVLIHEWVGYAAYWVMGYL